MEDDTESEPVPQLKSIFDDKEHFWSSYVGPDRGWKCLWCDSDLFKGLPNNTKAVAHVTRTSGLGVRPCDGNIDERWMEEYKRLKKKTDSGRKRKHAVVETTPFFLSFSGTMVPFWSDIQLDKSALAHSFPLLFVQFNLYYIASG